MNKNIKKIIFLIFSIWWSLQIIGDVFQKDSITASIWNEYNAILPLLLISGITIVLTLYSAYLYFREKKERAYKYLFIALTVNLIEGIIELIFVSMINKDLLSKLITTNRQEHGLPIDGVPIIVNTITWSYLAGVIIYAIILYFVYLHWQKIACLLQTKSTSAVIKTNKKYKLNKKKNKYK